MKVFISMPMDGKSNEEISEEIEKLIPTFGFNTSDFADGRSEGSSPLMGLAHAIEVMDDCDAVWFTPGWEEARGCKIERIIAEAYDIPIYE